MVSACALGSVDSLAAATDSEGMPLVYLKGDFNHNSWAANDDYRFSREGNVYTLVIDNRNAIGECEFKISNDDWSWNLGANVTVNTSRFVSGIFDGPNMKTSGMKDAVISFTYNPDYPFEPTPITFIIDGMEIEPEPEPQPGEPSEIYLRGDFHNTSWLVNDLYRFTRDGNLYTLNISSSNPIEADKSFKIGTADWKDFDFGASAEGVNIDYTQSIELRKGGPNLHTVNGIYEGTISFYYDAQNPDNSLIVNFDIPGTQKPPVSGMSGSLPVLYINVYTDESHSAFNNEVISKDLNHKNYFENAEYWLDLNGCEWLEDLGAKSIGSEDEPLPLQIKARGNWTRIGFSKKPFKLKLDKKQSLLGLSKSKHFAILAHADDQAGYMRNFVGFNLGKRIGLPWTPSQQPVEVVINGDYRGLYFLTESIRVEEDRVNITELNDNEENSRLVSGGYIVELDNYDEDESNQIRMDEKSFVSNQWLDRLRITFDTPEVYSDLQRLFITDQFSIMNDYVGTNDDRLWSYMDLDDAARYYLVEEIVSHTESYHGSTYLFRDYGDGQKWHFSPLWDFGNAFNGRTDNFFYNCDPFGNTWIPSMRENRKFNDKVKETWLWFMSSEYDGLDDDMKEYASHLSEAAQADYKRWNGVSAPAGGQGVADNRDMEGKRRSVASHLQSKIDWLKSQFGDFTGSRYAEPERDLTPAAELPPYVATGITNIFEADGTDEDTVYYSLQGVRLANPAPGTICIAVKGNKAQKVIIR